MDDKLWAPAGTIPRQMRPKMSQLVKYDWALQNPYPGWKLAIDQGSAGWKCKIMTDEEYRTFETGIGKSTNPKAINRASEAGPQDKSYPHSKHAGAEIAKRKHLEPPSTYEDEYSEYSSSSESRKHNKTKADSAEQRRDREHSPSSDAEDSTMNNSAGHATTPPTAAAAAQAAATLAANTGSDAWCSSWRY